MRGRLIVLGTAALAMPWAVARSFGTAVDPFLALVLAGLAVFSAAMLFALAARLFRNLAGPPWIRVIADILPVLPFLLVVSRLSSSSTEGVNGVAAALALAFTANEIVLGVAIPIVVVAFTLRYKRQGVRLDRPKLIDLTFLTITALYSFVPVFKRQLDLSDGVIYLALFMVYLVTSSRFRQPTLESGPLEELLATLPAPNRLVATFALVLFGLFAMFVSAGPFAESLVLYGNRTGVDGIGLVQWIGPVVALFPAILMSVLASLRGFHQRAMGDMVSLKVVLATAAIAFIPFGNASGTGSLMPQVMDAFQINQFLLITTQLIFVIAVVLTLSFTQIEAVVVIMLFFIQLLIPDPVVRQVFVVGYVVMAVASLALERRKIGVLKLAPVLTLDVLRNNEDGIASLQTIPDSNQTITKPAKPVKPGEPTRRKRKDSRRN